jgi:hypothetical protein
LYNLLLPAQFQRAKIRPHGCLFLFYYFLNPIYCVLFRVKESWNAVGSGELRSWVNVNQKIVCFVSLTSCCVIDWIAPFPTGGFAMNVDSKSDSCLLQNGTEPLMSRPSSGARQVRQK